jgi:riboflavin biosynthesis pyrimidine reductase
MPFPYIDFKEEAVTLTNCFIDESLLESIHGKGNPGAYLPKVEKTYGKLIFPEGGKYPYIFSSIALSMDGKMAYPDNQDGDMLVHSNKNDSQGAETDFYVLNLLRAHSDAVLIGTTSMKAEANVWVTIHDYDLVVEREKYLNKRPQPFVIVATKDGLDLPYDHMLFHQKKLPVMVFTSPSGFDNIMNMAPDNFYLMENITEKAIWGVRNGNPVVVTGTDDNTDIKVFMQQIKLAGVKHLLIESPTFMWFLMKERIMNEFFITYSTIFVGGNLTPGYSQPFTFENHPHSRVVQLNRHGNTFFYTRQLILDEEQ